MAKSEIHAGVCGYVTHVKALAKGRRTVEIEIHSTCPDIMRLAEDIPEVDAYKELTSKQGVTKILDAGLKHCKHSACPVPSGIVKTMEVAAGLAVPCDVSMHISRDD